jgi:immune inhibitor A
LLLAVALAVLLTGCTVRVGSTGPAVPTAIPAAAVLPLSPAPAPAAADTVFSGAELAGLSAAEQLRLVTVPIRDLAALRLRLDPSLETGAPPPPAPPDYQVGDTLEFTVHNSDTAENRRITAELVHRTDVAYAWVEQGQEHDVRLITRAVDTFSTRIYPAAVTAFGREASPGVDNDPRLHILHATGLGRVAGYFLGGDQNTRLGLPWSNEKEMFYISLEWLNLRSGTEVYETVLAHEFQHMIHHAHDPNEEVWINEGLSEYAQEVAGYPPDYYFAASYLADTDVQLNTWQGAGGANAPHYGAAYLFVRYLVQRFHPPIARVLVAESANGVEGVRRVLARQEGSPTFEQVFADWQVALAVDQPEALGGAGRYGYTELDLPPARPGESHEVYPLAIDATVGNFALDLIALGGQGDLRVRFEGEAETRIAPVVPFSGARMWWANRSDDSNARLTRRFDLSPLAAGEPVTLTATMWWDIEPDYDYGYVMASAEGSAWEILPGTRTKPLNPASIALGDAYTGASHELGAGASGWVTETFDLSAYAGGPLHLRFEYVTDDAVNHPGWFVDDLRIDAIGYADDLEGDVAAWQSEGWLLTDGRLDQRWLVQVLTLDDGTLAGVEQMIMDAGGQVDFGVAGLGRDRTVLLTISGLTEGTTEPAVYRLVVE